MTDWKEQGSEPITDKQHRMLCAVCGCLAKQIQWHGRRLSPDSWRMFLCGTAAGFAMVPAYDRGDGATGFVMLGKSIKGLSKTQAAEAITIGLHIGDQPQEQGIQSQPVRWSDAVLLGLGFNPHDF